jgi:hypothetical protein
MYSNRIIRPTSYLTDNSYTVLEGAAALVAVAQKIEVRIGAQQNVVLPRALAERVVSMMQDAATIIDNLMMVIELRELALTSPVRSPCSRASGRSKKRRGKSRKKE